ncbi:helix-turn-helix domain-containing protein [Limibacillus sp. MBR-115]|jgi:transcriptional regulator with XRE-family HTH domain|uniref:helix-turn-helix domain-containing protein n=1 Tax=Limibacillus sp. MBR-115 TaxID=3156465 RepID=UPI00339B96E8
MTKESAETLGSRIKQSRERMEISVTLLARKLGVKPDTVRAWEADKGDVRANKLMVLAGILNVSVNWLLSGGSDGAPSDSGSNESREIRGMVETLRQQLSEAERTLDQLTQRVG